MSPTRMARVAVIAHPGKPEAIRLAGVACDVFAGLGAEVRFSTSQGDDLGGFDPELAAVFGGDGTVLNAAARLGEKPPPILAFNLGRLGYLAENPPEQVTAIIRDAVAGKLAVSRRMTIQAAVLGGADGTDAAKVHRALNEFVIARTSWRQLALSIQVDGEDLMDMRGDGIIVCTPTGSTAYSLSAGGPVVSPELEAVVITPLAPHQLANRALVLARGETVTVRHCGDVAADLMADGEFCRRLDPGDTLAIEVAERKVSFLYETRGRYRLLREKLGWGAAGGALESGTV